MLEFYNLNRIYFLLGLFVLFGCINTQKTSDGISAQQYYTQALEYKKQNRLNKALEGLQKLQKTWPYSSYSRSTSLLIADIYFEQESYKKAETAYKKFKKIYPQSKVSYVNYQLGLVYFKQLPSSADRDLFKGEMALKYFKHILNPALKKQALPFIQKIQNLQAEKEFQAALFYSRKKWHISALHRLQRLIKMYPNSPLMPQALFHSYKLAGKLNHPTLSFKKQLLKKFPQSKEAQSL